MVERPGSSRREERGVTTERKPADAMAATLVPPGRRLGDEPGDRSVSVDPMRWTDHYRLVVPFAPTPRGLAVEASATR